MMSVRLSLSVFICPRVHFSLYGLGEDDERYNAGGPGSGRVGDRCGDRRQGQRLVDMGLYPGVEAKVVRRAPLGDPIEVDAEGALVNLRREEARFVRVKKL